ncbi:hypothetical protein EVAR_45462_1 [Eumeta japonica]|uniref:Uncharacterized protein n=1 Tax=Eumeta variegata TaxID=151549 RepID=A0A4C1WDP6_EUMVA|nr:hypothetical protein EVAR_45462_1 [Eumeta japonica]
MHFKRKRAHYDAAAAALIKCRRDGRANARAPPAPAPRRYHTYEITNVCEKYCLFYRKSSVRYDPWINEVADEAGKTLRERVTAKTSYETAGSECINTGASHNLATHKMFS